MTDDEWKDGWEEDRDDEYDGDEESDMVQDDDPDDFDRDDFDPNPDEDESDDWGDFDPNPDEDELDDWDDFDPNPDEDELDDWDDFDPNPDDDDEWDDFDPNTDDDDDWDDFNPYTEDEEDLEDFSPEDVERENEEPDEENRSSDIENIDSQSTVQVRNDQDMSEEESEEEVQDDESIDDSEVLTPDPDEYEQDSDPLHDADKAEFVKDMQELSEGLRNASKEEGEQEDDNTAFNAEQAYDSMKERGNGSQETVNETQNEEEVNEEVREKEENEPEHEDLEDDLPEEITNQDELDFLMQKLEDSIADGSSLEEIQDTMREAEKIYEELKDEGNSENESKSEESSADHLSEEIAEDDKEQINHEYQVQEIVDQITELSESDRSPEEIAKDLEFEEFENRIQDLAEAQEKKSQESQSTKDVDELDDEDGEDYKEEIINEHQAEAFVNEMDQLSDEEKFAEEIVEIYEKEHSKEPTSEFEEHKEQDEEDDEVFQDELERIDESERSIVIEDELLDQEEFPEEIDKEAEESTQDSSDTDDLDDVLLEGESFSSTHDNKSAEEEENAEQSETESEEETVESIKERYRNETGKKHTYNKKNTKAFDEWLKKEKIDLEKVAKREKERQEEDEERDGSQSEEWKETILAWIEDLQDEELQEAIKEILKDYDAYEDLEIILRNIGRRKLSEQGKERLDSIMRKLKLVSLANVKLYSVIKGYKQYYEKELWWNRNLIPFTGEKFRNRVSEDHEAIKDLERQLDVEEYTTMELFDDLFTEVTKLVPEAWRAKKGIRKGKIYEERLNEVLGFGQSFIRTKQRLIKNGKYPDYTLSVSQIDKAVKQLEERFGKKASKVIKLFERYQKVNSDIKLTVKQQWHQFNPNLKFDFFDDINSIEKAFWFGFLCADGYLRDSEDKGQHYVGVELAFKDKKIIEDLCKALGVEENFIFEREKEMKSGTKVKMIGVRIACKPIVKTLETQGMFGSKSKRKSVPKFANNNRILFLAWLRGYYEGDGAANSTKIVAANKQLLVRIKKLLNLDNKISINSNHKTFVDEDGFHINRTTYCLYLGAKIFNEMTSICKIEDVPLIERKNHVVSDHYEKFDTFKQKLESMFVDKKLFKRLLFKYSLTQLGKKFNVSGYLIKKLADEWKIPLPPKNYWNYSIENRKKIRNEFFRDE